LQGIGSRHRVAVNHAIIKQISKSSFRIKMRTPNSLASIATARCKISGKIRKVLLNDENMRKIQIQKSEVLPLDNLQRLSGLQPKLPAINHNKKHFDAQHLSLHLPTNSMLIDFQFRKPKPSTLLKRRGRALGR